MAPLPIPTIIQIIETIITATAARPIPIYLYHFPAQSGLPWHVRLVTRLRAAFGVDAPVPRPAAG